MADAVVITTPDSQHVQPAILLAKKGSGKLLLKIPNSHTHSLPLTSGYHILLEKPMAVTREDCVAIVRAVKENNRILSVGHVMR